MRAPDRAPVWLHLVASLVPADLRREWRAEWLAEVRHSSGGRTVLAAVEDALRLRLRWRGTFLTQLRITLRGLRRTPLWTSSVIGTLALGFGGTLTIFALVYGIMLRPLGYPEPDRLLTAHTALTYPMYEQFRAEQTSLVDTAAWARRTLALTLDGRPEPVRGVQVNAALMPALGVTPAFGRLISRADDVEGAAATVLLSWGLWKERFGGAPDIVGQSLDINDSPHIVVGVMPEGFTFPSIDDRLWISLATGSRAPGNWYLRVGGRVRDGRSVAAARAQIGSMAILDSSSDSGARETFQLRALGLHEQLVGNMSALLVFQAAVIAVLLIACVNVTQLLLSRAVTREQELAVRSALGAGRGHLVRLVLGESVILGLAGAAVGLVLANALVPVVLARTPLSLPLEHRVAMDLPVWLAALGLGTGLGLLVGVLPAARLGSSALQGRLRAGGRALTSSLRRRRWQGGLIVAQVGLALMLLIVGGLLLRSFVALRSMDPGLKADPVLAVGITLPDAMYPDQDAKRRFYDLALERVRSIPGVSRAAVAATLPFTGSYSSGPFEPEVVPAGVREPDTEVQIVSADYFTTMGIPLIAGRDISSNEGGPPEAVVNDHLAAMFFPEGDALGRRVRGFWGVEETWFTIVGVVGATRHRGLDQPPDNQVYLPYALSAWPWSMVLTVRAEPTMEPVALVPSVRDLVAALDDRLALPRVQLLGAIQARSVSDVGFEAGLLVGFATTALLLSVIGIYGVVAQTVGWRTRELGIRLALGARTGSLVADVMRPALRLTAMGLVAGLAGGFFVSRLVAASLIDLETFGASSLAVIAGAGLVLGVAAIVAALVPARRAARLDPLAAIRTD